MGVQGNYPGSGAINQHKYLAMRGETEDGPTQKNVDSHLHEGGEFSDSVGDPNMGRITPNTAPESASKDVRGINHV